MYKSKKEAIQDLTSYFNTTSIKPTAINGWLTQQGISPLQHGCKLTDLLLRPQITIQELADVLPNVAERLAQIPERREEIVEAVEINIKYEGYIHREEMAAEKLQRLEQIHIPADFDYDSLQSLSTEARQKLNRIRPATIGDAARIPGVSPNDISVLLVLMGR